MQNKFCFNAKQSNSHIFRNFFISTVFFIFIILFKISSIFHNFPNKYHKGSQLVFEGLWMRITKNYIDALLE